MPKCKKCGEEIKENDWFCKSCGISVKDDVAEHHRVRYNRERDLCFGREEPGRDPLGIVNFGLFLLIVGVVFSYNSSIIQNFVSWIQSLANQGTFVRPPISLISSASLFFGGLGVANLFVAVLRLMIDKVWRRILSDLLSGVGLLSFAYLINLYGEHLIAWTQVLAFGAIIFGILVIFYTFLRNVF